MPRFQPPNNLRCANELCVYVTSKVILIIIAIIINVRSSRVQFNWWKLVSSSTLYSPHRFCVSREHSATVVYSSKHKHTYAHITRSQARHWETEGNKSRGRTVSEHRSQSDEDQADHCWLVTVENKKYLLVDMETERQNTEMWLGHPQTFHHTQQHVLSPLLMFMFLYLCQFEVNPAIP